MFRQNRIFIYMVLVFLPLFFVSCSLFNNTKTRFEVVFNSMGGTEVESVIVEKGDKLPIPTYSEKEGYTLDGWYTSHDNGVTLDEKWSFLNSEVISNITLYAKWNINQYSITFIFDEIEDDLLITQDFSSSINFPQLPTKYGFVFDGWYLDEEKTVLFDLTSIPADNIILYAGWTSVEENDLTLIIHYLRFNEDYTDWRIQIWSQSPNYEVNDYHFIDKQDNWSIISLNLSKTNLAWANNIGFELIKGEMLEKDSNKERFIDLSSYSSGEEVHVYLVQGVDEVFLSYTDVKPYDILVNLEKDYYATGNFNGWNTVVSGKMESISRFDSRVSSIIDELVGVNYLYILEITIPAESSGWNVVYKIDGVNQSFDGNLTLRIIRTDAGDPDSRDFWAQSSESGKIDNLTPSTLYIPTYAESVSDGSGTWNDSSVALVAGTYYIVFAEFDESKAMGLIMID